MTAPRDLRQTHTFSIMNIGWRAYQEIRALMVDAGYQDMILEEDGQEVIDMHGIAVATRPNKPHPSHKTRISLDASSYDEICDVCGNTDLAGGGWGKLADPCPGAKNEQSQETRPSI